MNTTNNDEGDSSAYQSNSVDPGWPLTVGVILVCCAIDFVVLPLLVLHKRKHQTLQQNESQQPIRDTTVYEQHSGKCTVPNEDKDDDFSIASSRSFDRTSPVTSQSNVDVSNSSPNNNEPVYNVESVSVSADGGRVGDNSPKAPPPLHKLTQFECSWRQITGCDSELQQLVWLGIPYSIQGCKEGIFHIINIAILGQWIGTRQANTYVVVTSILGMTSTLSLGFREAISTLVAQAHGAGNDLLMGRYLQLGIILFVVANIPGVIIWSLWAYDAIRWFGFDDETATLGQEYSYPALLMIILIGIDDCLHRFLNITGHENYCTIVGLFASSLSTIAILTMAWAGCDDLILMGIVQVNLTFGILLLDFSIALYMKWLDDYWQGFAGTFSLKDIKGVYTMLAAGIPLGITWILNDGEWEVLTVFAGFMGAPEVTTWGILGIVWNTMDTVTLGISVVAQTRVGFYLASGEAHIAMLVAYKAIFLGAVVSTTLTSIFFMISARLPRWLTPDPTLQEMISELLPLFGFGQIFMGVCHACSSILAAQGRSHLVTTIAFITSWFVVVPVSAVTVYILNFNLLGPVAAIVLGYSSGGALWPYLVMTSDWTAYSKIVRSRSIEVVQDEECSWGDLPPDIQEAALVLGYNQELWDDGEGSEVCYKDWNDLNPVSQEAARKLGYNRKNWDRVGVTKWGRESHTSKSVIPSDLPECHGFSHLNWEDLPIVIQNAAEILGYNSEVWNSDVETDLAKSEWADLTGAQKDAAILLCYDESSWGEVERLGSNEEPESYPSHPTTFDYDEVSV